MYIDAILDRKKDIVKIIERINGKRIYKDVKPVHEFYASDSKGMYEAVTGDKCTKYTFNSDKEMRNALKNMPSHVKIFESDINKVFKTLSKEYPKLEVPDPHVTFFDIEVDYDESKGYSQPKDALNRVTMISFYHNWNNHLGAFVLKPEKTASYEAMEQKTAEDIVSQFDNVKLFDTEEEMLKAFLDEIDDTDILSGWNSEFFDIPYLINRTINKLGKSYIRRYCLWDKEPIMEMKEIYDKPCQTYQLSGRIHLDYLELYKKHSYSVLPSYKLDYIGEIEVNENKVSYEGTLHMLYHEDFYKFIEYGLKDTLLLHKIDDKKEFINLANQLAHQNTVLFPTTMGSVALIDNAIVNMAHSIGQVIFNKTKHEPKERKAAGAWVADPQKGLQEFIGLVDLNSLYPSCIRSLNMSTETIVAQIRSDKTDAELDNRVEEQRRKSNSKSFEPDWAEAWHGFFGTTEFNLIKNKDSEEILTVDFESGETAQGTGKDFAELLFTEDSNYIISANGTIFRKDRQGIIPRILTTWYEERQLMQRAAIDFKHATEEGISREDLDSELNGFTREQYMKHVCPEFELIQLETGLYVAKDMKLAKVQASYWKMMQQIRKILLNSLYGALLNEGSRFYDPRLGQSVTLTGRCITQHMACKVNEILAGEYNHVGGVAVYGDSVTGDTKINVKVDSVETTMTIEEIYNFTQDEIFEGSEKSYKKPNIEVITYDPNTSDAYYDGIHYVMKHNNKGSKFSIKSEEGHEIKTTSDHGIMVEVDSELMECSPEQIQKYINEGRDVFLITYEKD